MNLPDELVLNIMCFATIDTLGTMSSACRSFNELYRDDIIWEQKYKEICGFSERPRKWQRYPWFTTVKSMMTKKYTLREYKGKYDNCFKGILVSEHADIGQFTLYQVIKSPKIRFLPFVYLVQNAVKWSGWNKSGLHARILSRLSNPTWWFDLYDKKISSKNLIAIVSV
ncbi:F-box domain-containing protein [Pacmanvirus A23]|uniref:F-box domain-containing protein n=1 Tax=Pacmanvirus A23 TaxID=1932881 RepID=UPI000A09317F|nr:F-box domain-containing protein [Pacmanvirus A23]SIP86180.1 F-box domain-containing protein [Pacmanvirus A23]